MAVWTPQSSRARELVREISREFESYVCYDVNYDVFISKIMVCAGMEHLQKCLHGLILYLLVHV